VRHAQGAAELEHQAGEYVLKQLLMGSRGEIVVDEIKKLEQKLIDIDGTLNGWDNNLVNSYDI
jgi:hypothetical protein